MEKEKASHLWYIGGITGVGKTSIITAASEGIPNSNLIYGSRVLMDKLGCRTYEDLNAISDTRQQQARIEIFSELKQSDSKTILVDGHYVIFIRNGNPVSTIETEWVIDFDGLVHIVSRPEIILERLLLDEENFFRRLKNLSSLGKTILDKIERSQDISLENALIVSEQTSKPLTIIDNSADVKSGAEKLIDTVVR